MTIKRIIGGNEIKIELTSNEMLDAYCAKQFEFDREKCEDMIVGASDEEVEECYGVSKKQFTLLLDRMAELKREYMDKYGSEWSKFRDDAITNAIREWKEATHEAGV